MLEELQRRHYSEATTLYYIRKVEAFARHFQCPPDRLGPQHIREYQAHLFTKRKLSPGSVTNHLCALRFFYIQTLKSSLSPPAGLSGVRRVAAFLAHGTRVRSFHSHVLSFQQIHPPSGASAGVGGR